MSLTVGIAGLGAMGSMTALELARRGHRVIGFDRYRPPHDQGSSHGKSRIIREAYFEHPQYVPLVQRAYSLWQGLEQAGGVSLYRPTGGLMVGLPDGTLVKGARRSAEEHGLPYEELSAAETGARFPAFRLSGEEVGLFEPRAGVLFPERAIATALERARHAGAELHFHEPVTEWRAGARIFLRTERGEYAVDRLVLAAGAWMSTDLPGRTLPLTITRQTLFWFDPGSLTGTPAVAFPIFIWEWVPGRMCYGFPDLGDGIKAAIHHEGEAVDPGAPRRIARPEEADELRAVLGTRIPGLGPVRESAACLYSNTPSEDFLLDRHPDDSRVLLASPCSGHGFKFAPVIGEVLADLTEDRLPPFDLTPFRLDRVSQPGA
jgi:sarcosine oxidase